MGRIFVLQFLKEGDARQEFLDPIEERCEQTPDPILIFPFDILQCLLELFSTGEDFDRLQEGGDLYLNVVLRGRSARRGGDFLVHPAGDVAQFMEQVPHNGFLGVK